MKYQPHSTLPFFGALAVAAVLIPAPAHAAPGSAPPVSGKDVDAYVADYMDSVGVPGVVVAVTEGTEITQVSGYGKNPDGAMTADTPMRIASVTKSFTAAAAMRLVEDGKLDLDATVADQLDEFSMADERADDITLRNVLNQQTGIDDHSYDLAVGAEVDNLADAVAAMRDGELFADPGTEFRYNNMNFKLAARMIEVASGQSYPDYLTENILKPLHMDHTVVPPYTDSPSPGVTDGYTYMYGAAPTIPETHEFDMGAGNLISTGGDLAQWLIMQNNGGKGADGTRILSADSVEAMHTAPDNGDYGFGWEISELDGSAMYEHPGDLTASSAQEVIIPDRGIGVMVMSNQAAVMQPSTPLADDLAALLMGDEPSPTPVSWYMDLSFGVVAGLALVLGGIGVVRSGRWARRRRERPGPMTVVRLLGYLIPVGFLAFYPQFFGAMMGGRVYTLEMLVLRGPALYIMVGTGGIMCGLVVVTRMVRYFRAGPRRKDLIDPGPAAV